MALPRRQGRALLIGVLLLLIFPWILPSNWANMGVAAAIMTLALLSLVVLTGWVGQISLAQAALMGVGAFTAANATNGLNIDYPFHALIAGGAAAGAAALIGIAALRVRGLYLAIATLGFQWMLEASFLSWDPFSGGYNGKPIPPLKFGTYDFSDDRLMFYLAWGTAILVIALVANLRDSKTGRAWFAIRGSEIAAKSLGVDVMRYKLTAFAVSGFIVGVAGSLKLNFVGQATPFDYNFQKSILFLAVAVLGGVGAIGGALIGGIVFTLSDQYVFTEIAALRGKIDIAAAALLIFTILRNPGGLVTVREDIRERLAVARARREAREKRTIVLPEAQPVASAPGPTGGSRARDAALVGAAAGRGEPPPVTGGGNGGADLAARLAARAAARTTLSARVGAPPLLEADNVTVRFGGVVALDNLSMHVRTGEICGLIGPNGAGKTTFFNTVNGLVVPQRGGVAFNASDITGKPPHARAALGMARTFQIMKLFPRLTVFENLMVATHLQNSSGFLANMLMLERSRAEDQRNADQVRDILSFLGIDEYGDKRVAGLPFGILRLIELGRALVAQPKLLLLDEPASGLDTSETDALADHLFRIREEMGHTILLIEHDMRLVMMVSDYVYVLDFGRNLAEGLPAEVQRNRAVIAAYLGEEAVA